MAEVVQPMLDTEPDILCWCTSHAPMVHAMTEYAYKRGFKGQIISCTLDHYGRLIERTSPDFVEGIVFQFPDFDDPLLRGKTFFFHQPKAFFEEYNRRFPGAWSSVSWEYAAILDIWHGAVEKSSSVEAASVLAAMKQLGHVTHAFGPARWWGRTLFGIDNALLGDWPECFRALSRNNKSCPAINLVRNTYAVCLCTQWPQPELAGHPRSGHLWHTDAS